jgi:acetate---CoA ligase (ADP-forming)
MGQGFEALVGARSIAVVGASERNLIARIAIENLRARGFPGRVFGIHPRGEPVGWIETLPTHGDAGDPADIAVLAVGAPRLEGALRAAAGAGVGSIVIPGAGSNEGGPAVWPALRSAIDETGVPALGPNCMGFASFHERVVPYVGSIDPDLQTGGVGLVSQSGSVLEMYTAMPWRVGFSHVISVGNELGLDMTAALEFLVRDDRTHAIGLFIEGIRRPHEFRTALRLAAEADKPVVIVKVGVSELARSGAESHTGALAGDARVFAAVARDAGAILVEDLEEMLAALEMLGKRVERPTDRVLYVGDSGGEANLFADLASRAGVELPPLSGETAAALKELFPSLDPVSNPLDLWAIGVPEETYRDGLGMIAEGEPHLVVLGLDKFLARAEPERVFVRSGIEGVRTPGSVVLMAYAGSDAGDIEILRMCWEKRLPVIRGAAPMLEAMSAIARWRRWRREGVGGREPAVVDAATVPERWSEHAAKRLLVVVGIPITREREADSADQAAVAAEEIGFPVVVKMAGEDLAHKTEKGGVRVGVTSAEEVREVAGELLEMAPRVLVAEQRRADMELIVGAFVDDQFGPCALIGLGGVWTEALGQAAVIVGPGSNEAIRRALEEHAWGRLLLEGSRGRRFPVEAVAEVALRLLDVLTTYGDGIEAIEINPLFVEGDGVVAVDALVVPKSR